MEKKKYVDFDEVITTYTTFGHLNLYKALEAFNEIPAADVQPVVRGHWIRENGITHGRVMRVCLCSNCKRNALINEDGLWELSDFCPNCGADMREIINE